MTGSIKRVMKTREPFRIGNIVESAQALGASHVGITWDRGPGAEEGEEEIIYRVEITLEDEEPEEPEETLPEGFASGNPPTNPPNASPPEPVPPTAPGIPT